MPGTGAGTSMGISQKNIWHPANKPPEWRELGGCSEPADVASDEVLVFDEYFSRRTVARYFADGTWSEEATGDVLLGVVAWTELPEYEEPN